MDLFNVLRKNRRLGRRAKATLLRRGPVAPLMLAAIATLGLVAVSCQGGDSGKQAERAPIPVRVLKVAKGDIAVTLAYSGELKSVDTVDLLPSQAGRLDDVLVDEGSVVTAGQPLARIELDSLTATLKQQQAALASAQARLDTVLMGARPEDVAAANAQLEAARQRLQALVNGSRPEDIAAATAQNNSAKSKLADLEAGAKAADLAAAQAANDTAAANLARDQAKLRQLLNPTQNDLDSAQAGVDAAEAAVRSTLAKLQDVKAFPKPTDTTAAQAAVAAAESSLRAAELAYAKLIAPLNTDKLKKLIESYLALTVARDRLADAQRRGASADELLQLEANVRVALETLDAAAKDANTFVIGVRAEDVIAQRAAADSAKAALVAAQEKLNLTLAGPLAADLQSAQAAYDGARSNRDAAKAKLDRLKNPVEADVQTAQAAVDGSQAAFDSASAKLAQLKAGATAAELDAARATVAASDSAVAKAVTPALETDLAVQQALVTQQESLAAKAGSPYTKPDIDAAMAAVTQAQAAVEVAQINLNRGTIAAPFDAVVVKKNVSKGATVNAQTVVLSIVSKDTQVVFNVEEGSIGRLQEGQKLAFTVAAFGERRFDGTIVSIAPTADAASRTFRVRANFGQNAQGLRSGMFANVNVTVQERKGTLIVPADALIPQGQDNFVLVAKDDTAERRKVTVGLRNDQTVEIREGLEEGEQVVTRGNRTPLRPDDKIVIVQ
jgi:RND family efflux transporter MFP subunit